MDLQILRWVDATFHSQGWLNQIMKYITYLGEFGAAAIITAVVLLAVKPTRKAGVAATIALVLNVLLVNVILKTAVNRARPWMEFTELKAFYESCGVRLPTDSSFPSGHTAACICLATVLVIRFKLKGLPVLVAALLVAVSRIYLCVHYPTDVLGGLIIGSACGVAGHFLGKLVCSKWEEHKSRKSPPEQNE